MVTLKGAIGASILALSALCSSTAGAQSVADFYRGKTISMVIATAPGGDYDLRARLLARHIGRHFPGEPGTRQSDIGCEVGLVK